MPSGGAWHSAWNRARPARRTPGTGIGSRYTITRASTASPERCSSTRWNTGGSSACSRTPISKRSRRSTAARARGAARHPRPSGRPHLLPSRRWPLPGNTRRFCVDKRAAPPSTSPTSRDPESLAWGTAPSWSSSRERDDGIGPVPTAGWTCSCRRTISRRSRRASRLRCWRPASRRSSFGTSTWYLPAARGAASPGSGKSRPTGPGFRFLAATPARACPTSRAPSRTSSRPCGSRA